MTEEAEFLHIIPAQFLIIRQLRHKYRCTKPTDKSQRLLLLTELFLALLIVMR
ncbi:MAG: hypothetical protein KA436_12855 [Oligoflexales bacterium]|nr:hypothetical protein [Oligoflexales bacterium]